MASTYRPVRKDIFFQFNKEIFIMATKGLFKKGTPIKVTRAGKYLGKGTYVGKQTTVRSGDYHQVNMSLDKKRPDIRSYRASHLTSII
jgi:hypothetical protein